MTSGVSSSFSDSTSASLIGRVRARDGAAWQQLTRLYGPLVYRWSRTAGLQDSDAADVMQEVFRSVAGAIDDFQAEGLGNSFRGWLWTITRNHVRKFYNRQALRPDAVGGTDAHDRLEQLPDRLDEQHESGSDAQTGLAHRALELIRDEFEDRTWQAFWRSTVAGQSGGEIAQELDMTEGAVRQAKYRVLCRLREMLRD